MIYPDRIILVYLIIIIIKITPLSPKVFREVSYVLVLHPLTILRTSIEDIVYLV